jgi:hypothetical protein
MLGGKGYFRGSTIPVSGMAGTLRSTAGRTRRRPHRGRRHPLRELRFAALVGEPLGAVA